jgi:hypothetical protein
MFIDFHRFLYFCIVLMELRGCAQNFIDVHDFHGFDGSSDTKFENLWQSVGTFGNLWEPLGTCGNLWRACESGCTPYICRDLR